MFWNFDPEHLGGTFNRIKIKITLKTIFLLTKKTRGKAALSTFVKNFIAKVLF